MTRVAFRSRFAIGVLQTGEQMRHNELWVSGGLLRGLGLASVIAILAPVGCFKSATATNDGGLGGASGTGGAGATDGGTGGRTEAGTSDGSSDATSDGSSDATSDTSSDSAEASGPCTTSFGAGNPVQYAFNQGANNFWYQFIGHDEGNTGLTSSLGASFTDGHTCPGSLVLAVNFMAYQSPTLHNESVSTEIYFSDSPNGKNWSAYKALHAWVKVQTADRLGLNGVYFYVRSGGGKYQAAFGASATLSDWHELVIDLTVPASGFNGVVPNDVQLIGFEVALNQTPPTGAPATPSQAVLSVDDIWLEALPPGDGGTDAADGATGQ